MHQLFSPILVLRSVVYLLPSLTHLVNLERPQHLYEHLIAGLTGLEPAILGLTNLRCIPLKLQTNFEDCGNFEIPTRCLTNNRSASELTIHGKRYYQLYYRATNGSDGTRTHTSPLRGPCRNRTYSSSSSD